MNQKPDLTKRNEAEARIKQAKKLGQTPDPKDVEIVLESLKESGKYIDTKLDDIKSKGKEIKSKVDDIEDKMSHSK